MTTIQQRPPLSKGATKNVPAVAKFPLTLLKLLFFFTIKSFLESVMLPPWLLTTDPHPGKQGSHNRQQQQACNNPIDSVLSIWLTTKNEEMHVENIESDKSKLGIKKEIQKKRIAKANFKIFQTWLSSRWFFSQSTIDCFAVFSTKH